MSLDTIVAIVMDLLNLFGNYSNTIIAIANIILIIFIFSQLRDARKPIITTSIISRNKEVTDRPDVLESDTQYLVVTNNSKNIAKSINISYQFDFEGHSIKGKEKKLSRLNPNEATKIILKSKLIMDDYKDLFEKVVEGNTTKIIPMETMKINLIISVRYNPIFLNLFKYIIEDNYFIEWGSRKNYPNFEDHPVFKSWNKRNDYFYIYKIDKPVQEVKMIENADNDESWSV